MQPGLVRFLSSWADQVDARNGGRYDQWLIAKPSGKEGYEKFPLTMGYYNRGRHSFLLFLSRLHLQFVIRIFVRR